MKKSLLALKIFICVFVFAGSRTDLTAQPFTMREDLKPVELTLERFEGNAEKEKGRISCVDINQADDTLYLFAKGISIYSPVFVSLTTEQGSPGVKVNMHKENWTQVVRTGETDNNGHWDTKFKTEGDFGIMVIAPKLPAAYNLLVWVGDEVAMALPMVYKKPKAEASFFKKYLLYIVIGVAALGLLLFLWRWKKRNIATALLLILFCMPVGGKAQGIRSTIRTAAHDFFMISDKNPEAKAARGAINENLKDFNEMFKLSNAVKDLYGDFKKLSPSEADLDFGQSSSVMIPSGCLEGYVEKEEDVETLNKKEEREQFGANCGCFYDATRNLDGLRRGLARLQVICTNTRNFTNSAIALGDAVAGSVGVGGLQWNYTRRDIQASYAGFLQKASNKHTELMTQVETALKKIGECEARFGERDWYQKFGFIYYQFLYDRYKP